MCDDTPFLHALSFLTLLLKYSETYYRQVHASVVVAATSVLHRSSGYSDDGCTCRRNAQSITKQIYTRSGECYYQSLTAHVDNALLS